ncbi:MAG: AraC family transcriptional regulator [Hyphomicrobiales bacterium]|nr:MAG: AraC family transcriptional regulator [Hyphomicrobiales bacterium]
MNRHPHDPRDAVWTQLAVPADQPPPRPIRLRAQHLPARHYFPLHAHDWHQLVYAVAGVLTVSVEGRRYAIPPEQAAWVPAGMLHGSATLLGAEFHSLYVAADPAFGLAGREMVFAVPPLLRALILEVAALEAAAERGPYRDQVLALVLSHLRRMRPAAAALPWPGDPRLVRLCEALHARPDDPLPVAEWGRRLGMSERTLARRFLDETGMTLRAWRRRLRLFRGLELLEAGMSVTDIAIELGYASTSAFIYMFRAETGESPDAYRRRMAATR